MIIICKKETKKIIKGVRYELERLWNSGTTWRNGKLYINNIGYFNVKNFTDVNGNDLPKIDINPNNIIEKRITFEELEKGDIIVCDSDRYKTLLKGGMYRIEDLITKKVGNQFYYQNFIKFEGVSRALKFNPWVFKRLDKDKSREISLNILLDDCESPVIISDNIKKIDMMDNKDQVLIENIAKSIVDVNRHHLSTLEWTCKKIGTKLSLELSDFDHLLDLPLRDILKIMDEDKL